MERHHDVISRQVHVGLEVVVAQVDRGGEGRHRVLAGTGGVVGAPVREGERSRMVQEGARGSPPGEDTARAERGRSASEVGPSEVRPVRVVGGVGGRAWGRRTCVGSADVAPDRSSSSGSGLDRTVRSPPRP